MLPFPPRVDKVRGPLRAVERLRYMVTLATLQVFGKPSIRHLALQCGFSHPAICQAIDRGWMTEAMAKSIEKAVGRNVLPYEYLTEPLTVGKGEPTEIAP